MTATFATARRRWLRFAQAGRLGTQRRLRTATDAHVFVPGRNLAWGINGEMEWLE